MNIQPLINTARYPLRFYRNLTSPLRLLPDFLIIGTQKGGTTSLYNYLTEHPNIAAASRKEIHFFDQYYHKDLWWYRSHFPIIFYKLYRETLRREILLTGEGSPEYLFYPHTASKVAYLLPQIKLITLLRNPVDRAYSQYRHNVRWGHEKLSFAEALDLEEIRTKEGKAKTQQDKNYHNFSYQRSAYLARGIYVDQLKNWMNFFSKDQMLIIRSEDFYADPASIYQQTLSFLGVPALEPGSLQKGYTAFNQSRDADAPSDMDPVIRKRLGAYFEPHNERLYALLGRNFHWDK